MKLAIISRHDSPNTLDLVRAAQARNIDCKLFALQDLAFEVENLSSHVFFQHDVYLFRGFNRNYALAQSLAQYLSGTGKKVIDSKLTGGYIPSKFQEALVYKMQGLPHIPTYQAASIEAWQRMNIHLSFPVIIKDIDSERGKGVRLCQDEVMLIEEIRQKRANIIIQDFVEMQFDIRVICVGDKVIGAIKREASGSEFRTNVSLGGRATSYDLNEEESTLALKAHHCLGYEISGVDMAYDTAGKLKIIETNISPEWQGFKEATGIHVAESILDYLMEK